VHVDHAIAHGHREVVAAVLALGAHLPRHPPHGRMVEEQRLDHRLEQVHQIVLPPHVRQLVGLAEPCAGSGQRTGPGRRRRRRR
jgi:hypothetical protein